jgi:hypothetical protein
MNWIYKQLFRPGL